MGINKNEAPALMRRGAEPSLLRRHLKILPLLLCGSALSILAHPAFAGSVLPSGGHYVAGAGTIGASARGMTITQASGHGIIDWRSFSVGAGNTVRFNNGSGATLNRVTGGNLSQIDGALRATGSVYLINPQGIVIGPGGKVVTNGSFVASTRDISNSDFMNGGSMTASGSSDGDVVNAGTITSKTGDAILVGRSVTNTGTIGAPNGQADMAAGNEVVLQPAGSDPRIAVSGGKGDVTNAGTVKAAQAALASAGGNVYALVENNGGIDATGSKTVDGHVWLTAGGDAQVSGTVAATNADGSGGTVTARAQNISVTGTIDASATRPGKAGGDVSVVARADTTVSGAIRAKGKSGDSGGTVETSGHTLDIGGASVDAGHGGQWLLDPTDLTVDASAASTIDSTLGAGTDVTLQTTSSGASGPGTQSSGSGDITIASALSWSTAATLTLDAYHGITIEAPITVSGSGGVVLTTNDGGTGGDYGFGLNSKGFSGSIDFTGGPYSGASLIINGQSYRLLYSASDVRRIDGLVGDFALANNIDATNAGKSGFAPVSVSLLFGTLTGLGHSISNITNQSGGPLFFFNLGTVRDLGIRNADLTYDSGDFGVLAGINFGTISNAFTTGSVVTGSDSTPTSVGGLVGDNEGSIIRAYSTASVQTQNPDAATGGLVGSNGGTISESYATGTVTVGGDSASGGGLVGANTGSIDQSYATGDVIGNGPDNSVGGLAGHMASGSTAESYATGQVTLSSTGSMGGLIGNVYGGTIKSSYFDTATTGIAASDGVGDTPDASGVTGLPTAQLQDALPNGFDSSVWGTGTGLYPYLKALTRLLVSGTVYASYGGSPLSGANVIEAFLAGGATIDQTTTDSHGVYRLNAPSSSGKLLLFLDNSNNTYATTVVDYTGRSLTDVNLYGGNLNVVNTTASNMSGVLSALSGFAAPTGGYAGNDFLLSVSGGTVTPTAGLVVGATGDLTVDQSLDIAGSNGLVLDAGGTITIDGALKVGGTVTLDAAGAVTQSAAITAGSLDLLGSSANYTLDNASNSIGTLAADTGAVTLADSGSLTIGSVGSTTGVTSSDAVTLTSGSDLTIDAGASVTAGSGSDAVLSATGNFVNNEGSDAVEVSGGGRWLIYSKAPGSDTFGNFGNLDSSNTAVWDSTYSTLAPGSVSQGGNRYIFAYQPTLTVTTTDVSKTYGDDATSSVASAYIIGSVQAGVSGAFLGDSAASVYSGTPSVTSSGSAKMAGVTASPYTITAAAGSLSVGDGYKLAFANTGTLTVNARPITITTDAASKTYGDANPAFTYTIGGDGLVNGDTLIGSLTSTATTNSGVGTYDITQGTLTEANNPNYAISYTTLTDGLTVTARPVTITADAASKSYGDANPAFAYTIGGDGLATGDTLTGSLTSAATAKSGVGPYDIAQGTLTEANNPNYTISYTTLTDGLTVTARPITITVDAASKTYGDGAPSYSYTITGDGLANSDSLSGVTLASSGDAATANAGSYDITSSKAVFASGSASNYSVTYATLANGLTVNARPITITADAASKTFGDANPAFTYAIGGDGLVNGDTLTGSLTSAATATSDVGSYTITQGTLALSPNYALAYTPGTLTITPAPLSITANDTTAATLESADPTARYSGFVNGDSRSVVAGLQFGLFPVTGNGLLYDVVPFGASATNYVLTYYAGQLTLIPATPDSSTAPLLGDGGYTTSTNFTVTANFGNLSFSNVATSEIGGSDSGVLLFQVGLPGDVSSFGSIAIGDYSNATRAGDRLGIHL